MSRALLVVVALAAVCIDARLVWGPQVGGIAQPFARLTGKRGRATQIGLEFETASLPTAASDMRFTITNGTDMCFFAIGHEFSLPLRPLNVSDSPFDHIGFNWNPTGHTPTGIYDLPHFDFHFYTITMEDRYSIKPAATCDDRCIRPPTNIPQPVNCADYDRLNQALPAAQLPSPGYLNVGAMEPEMGNHLVHVAAPEFNGAKFSHTWIYGQQDGKLSFYEPMITLETFKSLTNMERVCHPIPSRPQQHAVPGFYPTRYCIRKSPRSKTKFLVFLDNFVKA